MSETDFGVMLEKLDLHEIERLKLAKEALTWLDGRRRALQEQISAVDEQIAEIKAGRLDPSSVLPRNETATTTEKQPRKRRQQEGSLTSRVVEVLRGKEDGMGIKEIVKAILETGYETSSKNFRQQVAVVLGKMDEVERVGYGVYRLKAAK